MSKINTDFVDEFWDMFRSYLKKNQIPDDQFMSYYKAGKENGIDRRLLKSLADDNLLRTKDDKVAVTDVKLWRSILDKFQQAKSAGLIKETEITGVKKYLMLDFQQNINKKTVAEHQVELLFSMFESFFSNFYDIVPKKDVEIPEKIKKIQKS